MKIEMLKTEKYLKLNDLDSRQNLDKSETQFILKITR